MDLVKRGENFQLTRRLGDGRTDKYVRAIIFDSAMNQQSVHTLPHIQDGIYSRNDVQANFVGVFIVSYTVYRDSGFTKIDRRYRRVLNKVRVENIVDQLTDVIDLADGQIA